MGIVENDLVVRVPQEPLHMEFDDCLVIELEAGARFKYGPGNVVLVESIVVKLPHAMAPTKIEAYICQRGWRNGWEE